MKKRLVILDTHAILHRAYHALPDFSSSRGEPTGALYGLISMLVKIINDLKPDYIAACYDLPGGTFRSAAYEEYKATRVKAEDDLIHQIKRTRDVLGAFGIPGYDAKGFEADDCIGTIVEQLSAKGGSASGGKNKSIDIIIASGDMDTLQLVDDERVRVFAQRKGLTDVVMYDEKAVVARYGFGPAVVPDLKGIAGDTSDNIKGVQGVGEGSALKLLQTYGDLKKLYAAIKKDGVEKVAAKSAVQKRFVQLVAEHKEDADFSKELATIRRDAPIEFILPAHSWRQGVDTGKLFDLLAELDFRSLVPRVKQLLNNNAGGVTADGGGLTSDGEETSGDLSAGKSPYPESAAPPEDMAKAALAVSVLDSSIAVPELEDILRMGKSHDFATAYKNLLKQIKERELEFVYEHIELPLMPVLRRMENRGVLVDKSFLKKLSTQYSKELDTIAARIYKHAGGEFNIDSPKQLGEVLFDTLGLTTKKKTPGGARSTRESELAKLAGAHPIIDDILSYRELAKLLSTYIDSIPALLDKDNRLHTHYIQIGAATGRIASQNPNLQNIPIKSDLGRRIRHAFLASKGMRLVSFDYSQIELRIAAMLSGDEGLIEIFAGGRDVHAEVASRVFRIAPKDVSYEQRRRAKVINFGILYGMGVTALQQSLGTNRKEAQEFYNQYFETFPRLAAYLDEVKADAARKGYTQTLFGRRRYMEGIHSPIPYVRAASERMAINAPMQGTQADIIKLAMVKIDKLLEGGEGYLLLQVHDELVFEIGDTKVVEYAQKIKEIMEGVLPRKDVKGVPVIAEGKAGKNWGEMEKI